MAHVRDLSSVSQADMAVLEGLFPPDFPEVWAEFTRVFFVGLMASKELAEGTEARARVAIEAGATMPWYRFTGLDGKVIGLDDYGASAPQEILYKEFGLTAEHLAEAVKSLL